jgi:hypothetical protein
MKKIIDFKVTEGRLVILCEDGTLWWYHHGPLDDKGQALPPRWVQYTTLGLENENPFEKIQKQFRPKEDV